MTSEAKTIDLRSNLIGNVAGASGELPIAFLISSYHTFGDNSDCLRKTQFSRNLTFGDLW